MGQRNVPVVLLVVWHLVLAPSVEDHRPSHLLNVQRLIVGVAMDQFQPGHWPNGYSRQSASQAAAVATARDRHLVDRLHLSRAARS